MIKLAVSGARGRMGQKIIQQASSDPKTFKLTTLLERKDHPEVGKSVSGINVSSDNKSIKGCDVLIEFTLPEGTLTNLKACVTHKVAMVIGTTGLNAEGIKKIKNASKTIPIVFASNMSIGVNVLFKMTELAAKKLQSISDLRVYEEHHIHKKDAPSGTAKTLAEIAKQASGHDVRFYPEPKREGEIIGNHEVTFETKYDILKLYHHAKDRDMFASGSLVAAKFLQKKSKGLFNMQQVLGLDRINIP